MVPAAKKQSQIGPYRPGKHFAPLDGLRGIAILMVMLFHFRFSSWTNPFDHLVWLVSGFGAAGVDLFFVLSGFLITGILIDAKGGAHYFLNFYMRRTLRIFPLYYAYLVAMLLLLPQIRGLFRGLIHQVVPPIPHQAWLWLYGSNIAVSFLPDFITPGFDHLWSLAVEEQFYLVWPLVVLLASRRWLGRICVAMVLLAPAIRTLCWLLHFDMASVRLMPARMDTLALGGLIALAVRNPNWVTRQRKHCNWLILLSGACMVAMVAWRGSWDKLDLWVDTLGLTILAVLATMLLIKVLAAEPGLSASLFNWALLRSIGKYSYGIYVLHVVAEHLLGPIIERHLGALPLLLGSQILRQMLFSLLLSTIAYGLAWCSWHGFEKWFLLLKNKFPYREKAAA